jgi:uncharacterized protein (TIGR02391 family)
MARVPRDPPVTSRHYRNAAEVDRSIVKLERRIAELKALDVRAAERDKTGAISALASSIVETIRDAFGGESAEYREHQYHDIWGGPMGMGMSPEAVARGREQGKTETLTMLGSLVDRLKERREDFQGDTSSASTTAIAAAWTLLHPKVRSIAQDRFLAGHYADAVEAAMKELTNSVKAIVRQRGGDDLDGVPLMQTAFSAKNPLIVLADLSTATGKDMQRGYMDLFSGAVAAVRNPKAHANVSITPERAIHLLFLASTLWFTLDERPM